MKEAFLEPVAFFAIISQEKFPVTGINCKNTSSVSVFRYFLKYFSKILSNYVFLILLQKKMGQKKFSSHLFFFKNIPFFSVHLCFSLTGRHNLIKTISSRSQ
ncbi:MAG: hypothetical protein D3913_02880 [Candidatus Electrothrix sp. LOE1_4_5]|nr:hypothetical protein [Candidatus Electrothrix sp. AX1]MCI5116908.1 hypothetical protein [Candidatus Electrothrix gigas]